jgi:hypothetical protein
MLTVSMAWGGLKSTRTVRLHLSRHSQVQPSDRINFRLARPLNQLSKQTQRGEQVVLGQAVVGFVVEAVVTGDVAVAVSPQQGQQVDALDGAVVLARPVPADQAHLPGVGLVQGGVVQDQDALVELDLGAGLLPEGFGIGLQTRQQAAEGVVGGRGGARGLDARRLGAAELAGRGQQELDVVFGLDFRWVHTVFYAHAAHGNKNGARRCA